MKKQLKPMAWLVCIFWCALFPACSQTGYKKACDELTEVPPKVFHMMDLEILNLHGNTLRVIPHEIGRLTSLNKLSLNGNELAKLPPGIGQLENLQELKLEGSPLTSGTAWIKQQLPNAEIAQ